VTPLSLSDLFFELSNDTRIDILRHLCGESQRLTDLSKHLNLPAQEISRQLSRLVKLSMVYKDSEGLFHATPFSLHLLELVPSYDFLYSHRDYFTTHTMNELPNILISRIGELNNCTYQQDIMMVLHRLEDTLRAAEEYIHIMLDQMVSHTMPILEEKVKSGVEFHFLTTKNLNPPPGIWRRFNVKLSDLNNPSLLDTRFIDAVPMGLIITEKEVGLISFKTVEGKIDYIGFNGADEMCHRWSSDAFEYCWAGASENWPKELLEKALNDLR
jgi:predicted transcriptional regulator